MADSVEKLQKQAMVKRGSDKAEAAVVSLGKLARKKGAKRDELLSILQTISAKSPQTFARMQAFEEMGKTITAEDDAWLNFLRQNLDNGEATHYIVQTLLRLFDQEAYRELIDIIADKKRSMDTRMACLEAISDHSRRPFDQSVITMNYDKITEDMIPVKKLQQWAAEGFPPPQPIAIPVKDLKKLGIELPPHYEKLLKKHSGDQEYETDEGQWRLYAADELLTKLDVDGHQVAAIKQLSAYADTLAEVLAEADTTDDKGKPYPLKRLAAGWAIGTEGSGDVLYLDPADKQSVWVFHHDGGDVERVAKSFGGWLRTAEPC